MAAMAVFFFAVALLAAGSGNAAVVEHTFVVSQVHMKHLCKDMLVTVVNGQLPGPVIEVREGDSVAVHVVNKSPYGVTIHWHGLKQRLNCWADGPAMITQCPIQPNNNFTYRFDVAGQEGTLWWHAHVPCLRATVHGAFVIRPRFGASSYPFPKPDKEIPIVIGLLVFPSTRTDPLTKFMLDETALDKLEKDDHPRMNANLDLDVKYCSRSTVLHVCDSL